jgi:hypothetical protein
MKLDGNSWQSLSIFRGFFWAEKRGEEKRWHGHGGGQWVWCAALQASDKNTPALIDFSFCLFGR